MYVLIFIFFCSSCRVLVAGFFWPAEDRISSSVHISSLLGCLPTELQADTKDYVLHSLLHIRQECWDQPPATAQMEQGGFIDTVTGE